MLERIRQDYPLALHGVAMSLGSADGLDLAYLRELNALADRLERPIFAARNRGFSPAAA